MTSLISTNTAQVVMQYALPNGGIAENVYYVHKTTAWTQPELEGIATAFANWEDVNASTHRSNQISLVRITVTDLTSLTSPRVDNILAVPIVGAVANGALPSNVTFSLKANIGERGKGRNGRTFWIGLWEDAVSGDLIEVATANLLVADMEALEPAVVAEVPTALVGIIHTQLNKLPVSPATFSEVVSYSYTDLYVDSQRDRLPGHKRHKKYP